MKMLRILKAKDPSMWYATLVGSLVPYLGKWSEGYKSRESAGYINIVYFSDATIVDVQPSQNSGSTGKENDNGTL
jgi:hypothetical protein